MQSVFRNCYTWDLIWSLVDINSAPEENIHTYAHIMWDFVSVFLKHSLSMLHISMKDISLKEKPEHRCINHTSLSDRNNIQQNSYTVSYSLVANLKAVTVRVLEYKCFVLFNKTVLMLSWFQESESWLLGGLRLMANRCCVQSAWETIYSGEEHQGLKHLLLDVTGVYWESNNK